MKRPISLFLAIIITLSVFTVTLFSVSATDKSRSTDRDTFGDIDGDGDVTIVDATFIQRHSVAFDTPYPIGEPISDSDIYDVTEPQIITTDTDNYLASSNNKSDRSADIAAVLTQAGCCILGSGDFYVSGVELPEGAMIRGQGNSTRIIWTDSDAENNFVFKLNSKCSLSDMTILGSTKNRELDDRSENIGGLSGVLIEGAYDGSTSASMINCTLSNLTVSNVAGCGIKISRTGISPASHTQILNCNVSRCDCGIMLDTYSEFNMSTNVASQYNYYGVICKGGNNRFYNCDFSKNNVGVYMPCSNEPNNAHGIFVGCEIAHSNPDNNGYAVICEGVSKGERFEACTIGFGKIKIKDSKGIKFSNSGISKVTLELENSTGFIMNSCSVGDSANFKITQTGKNRNTRIINCFTSNGNPFTLK